MFAWEEPSLWNKAAEIGTWVLLFFVLIPGTTLAYFAETSLPNTPLYPIKRDIESVVLALSSINTSAKTFYQINLARTRLQETQQIVTKDGVNVDNVTQFNTVMAQILAANNSISTVTDATQKTQMKQQLQQTTAAYKKQLAQIQQQLQNTSATSSIPAHTTNQTTNTTDTTTNTPTQNISPNEASANTPPPNTTTSNLNTLSEADKVTLEQTIEDINTQLDTIDTTNTTTSPDTTELPTITPLPTVTPTPTPSSQHHANSHHEDNNQNDSWRNNSDH